MKITKLNEMTQFWIICYNENNELEFVTFENAEEMHSIIENIVVSSGEENKWDGILYESMSFNERTQFIKNDELHRVYDSVNEEEFYNYN